MPQGGAQNIQLHLIKAETLPMLEVSLSYNNTLIQALVLSKSECQILSGAGNFNESIKVISIPGPDW